MSDQGEGRTADIDTSVPHSARIWNYWLGGKDNYPVDRIAGDEYVETFPGITTVARLTRHFLKRSVGFMAGEAGLRQFLDVGTGLPTADNAHQVAQRVAPEARIVYVDNDPLVLLHAQALLTGTAAGATDYVDADLREPDKILDAAARTLDLDRPVGLTFMGVLGHLEDDDEVKHLIDRLVGGLAPGSHVAIADGSSVASEAFQEAQQGYDEGGSVPYKLRGPDEVRRFFDGLELLEPGLVPCLDWRPEMAHVGDRPPVQPLAGIARKA
ncbi:SAM-dependent methyltransferase [Actinomadura sp. WMMB 499]|uniref:SAM-dependent methyltransferase n=1 Tax=Actinomadura sp. WMMB 499 TaxID=1219491 RepID=UPI00124655E7|nr:SAM-dependent methyltransferase [Actinomadura sp. WMMB 499]QFG21614.1 SAM-dependent methyltransferase [Actinomadura sp. WMMB 499]